MRLSDKARHTISEAEKHNFHPLSEMINRMRVGHYKFKGQKVLFSHKDVLKFFQGTTGIEPNDLEQLILECD